MDADASHRPEQLPRLLEAVRRGADLAIGSRWVPRGAVHDWPLHRLLLSRGANLYVRALLGLGVSDATAGFRVFRAELLAQLVAADIASQGYCFQIDMTRRARDLGAVIAEVPIDFDERTAGASKMSSRIVREALVMVTSWGLSRRAQGLRNALRSSAPIRRLRKGAPVAAQQPSGQGASARPTAHGPAPTRRGSRWGSLAPALIIVLGLVELAILVLIGVNTSLWWAVLATAIGWLIGTALLVAAGQQSFVRLRSLVRAVRGRGDVQDHLSRPAFTLVAALFFFFPGILTDLIGIVLLLTPVQRRTVRAMGLGSGAESARTVLYRRSGTGVIDGEIILENRPRDRGEDPPPTLIQE